MMDTFSRDYCEQTHVDDGEIDDDHDHDHQEESGWTTYLDDFSNQYNRNLQDSSSCSLLGGSPSLVSDAATHVFSGQDFPARLKFGRTRAKYICDDESLEDTATSPANSPKVSDHFEHIRTLPRKSDEYVSSTFLMENTRSTRDRQIQEAEMMIKNHNKNNNIDLRSKGLCVVPISMLANFNGRF